MLSAVLKRKLILNFYRYDTNRDGVLELDDFLQPAKLKAASLGIKSGSTEYKRMMAAKEENWVSLSNAMGNGDKGIIVLDEYLDKRSHASKHDDEKLMQTTKKIAGDSFDFLDHNHHGKISSKEYVKFLQHRGIAQATAEDAFKQLDTAGHGYLTKDQYQHLSLEYYFSDNPKAPGNWLYG